jgi:hypothetical protein
MQPFGRAIRGKKRAVRSRVMEGKGFIPGIDGAANKPKKG